MGQIFTWAVKYELATFLDSDTPLAGSRAEKGECTTAVHGSTRMMEESKSPASSLLLWPNWRTHMPVGPPLCATTETVATGYSSSYRDESLLVGSVYVPLMSYERSSKHPGE